MKRVILTVCAALVSVTMFCGVANAGCFHYHHHHGHHHCCYR